MAFKNCIFDNFAVLSNLVINQKYFFKRNIKTIFFKKKYENYFLKKKSENYFLKTKYQNEISTRNIKTKYQNDLIKSCEKRLKLCRME